jgi:hypothetical protein
MLKDFLRNVEEASQFVVDAYDGQLQIKGTVLSPAQVESASLASTLALQGIADQKGFAKMQKMQEELSGDPTDETIDEAYRLLSQIRPEQLAKISQNQDQILCRCVQYARKAGEEKWERIYLVITAEEQNSEQNRLWVGMLSKEDRNAILEQAMKGQGEAVRKLQTFRRQ